MYSVANDATCWEKAKTARHRYAFLPVTKARIIFGNVHTVYLVYMCIGILLTLYINILSHAVLIALRFNGHRSPTLTSLLGIYRAMQKKNTIVYRLEQVPFVILKSPFPLTCQPCAIRL